MENRLKILIVDDNLDLLRFLVRTLAQLEECEIFSAETAVQAEELISKQKPDVGLIDYQLPDHDGMSVAVQLRAVRPSSVVTVMSAYEIPGPDQIQAENNNIGFLPKPFLITEVLDRIVRPALRAAKSDSQLEVFLSYSHKDEKHRLELEKHLTILKRSRVIRVWHDHCIDPGQDFVSRIDTELNRADIILLLVSSDFLSSDFCYGHEMERAIKMHEMGLARVIPIILRPVDWHEAPFGGLLALPSDGRPVTRWPQPRDEAFLNIAKGIRQAAKGILDARKSQPA